MKAFGWKPTIRTSLIILVLACIVPAALAGTGLAYYSFKAERQQLLDNTLARARALTAALDHEMIEAEGAIRALGTSPSLTSGDFQGFYQQAIEVQAQQEADNVVLSEPSGQQIINTLLPYGAKLPFSRSPHFEKLLEADHPMVTDLFVGAVSKQPHFSIQIPIRRDDHVMYTLTIGMFPKRIDQILPQENAPSGQVAGVLDSSGVIVARTKGKVDLVGQKIPAEIQAQMANRSEGYFPTKTADGTPAILLFSRSQTSHWVTYLTIPEAFFTQKLWDSLKWVVSIPLLLAALVLTFVWRVGGAIAKSITDLTAPALALGYGQEINVGPLYLREADEVGQALVEASYLLKAAQYEARHDKLTGLANRALFNEAVQGQMLLCKQMKATMAVLYIDLDGFKAVNDTHGHSAGDELLCSVASRLSASVGSSGVVARLGGDEFAILLANSGNDDARVLAETLIENVSAPHAMGHLSISISASIGIALLTEASQTPHSLLRAADEAMYRAKRAGRQRYVVADPSLAA
ncbi:MULTISPECIES: sensor domain-containing diguanylate cyclase [unclassified Rhizobium]|jgi:diguanylate cyclase (GGDEF)-like protein|uniref:sensor domain-containing diguanylate cyclase n=1 Tax=unclassified Rhizobium TaxID=2613769 RepID=UPI000645A55F|nr:MULTISPECIES: sensor domain-containing diguanylate cyclase [unclassified Rhizobium]MBN8953650.1 GGDEF domain-containing protein [Rhizobium tropici]OJY77527.1 MAG: hypothetical protein BGP09_28115 [Rhizobium sp. 60-20]RKD56075.1 diguanylate cyclase (GGDEF)-like protein [Rhizobium sp. WW_1]